MLEIHKSIVVDEDKKPVAVQIPIEFQRIEEVIENCGLAKLMAETEGDERLSSDTVRDYCESLNTSNVVGRIYKAFPEKRGDTSMPNLLTTSSGMTCPHSGTVTATSANSRVKIAGELILRASDTFTIAGCPFAIGPTPHPCTEVRWVQPDSQSQVLGDFTLSDASVGLCVAADQAVQGAVLINVTQQKVSGR